MTHLEIFLRSILSSRFIILNIIIAIITIFHLIFSFFIISLHQSILYRGIYWVRVRTMNKTSCKEGSHNNILNLTMTMNMNKMNCKKDSHINDQHYKPHLHHNCHQQSHRDLTSFILMIITQVDN